MKLLITSAIAILIFATSVCAQKPLAASSDAKTKDEILQLERERNQAILHGDAAALERMTADDYTFITLRGELRTKAEIVQGFKSGSFHYDSREISELNVRVYGSTAVVTGRSKRPREWQGLQW
jgi:ketosteroid isomerase-like protein